MADSKMIRVFGIPMDLGQNRRGVDMGPSAIRYAGLQEKLELLGYTVSDEGNIASSEAEQTPEHYNVEIEGLAHFLPEVAEICDAIYANITCCLKTDERGVFIGGDHSMSIGTVAAALAATESDKRVGVLWIDAHTDMNTPKISPSGNIHGMALAALLGHGPARLTDVGTPGPKLKARDVALVGVRDVDVQERHMVKESGVGVYTMHDVDILGMSAVAQKIVEGFADYDYIHVSLDLDSCDPSYAPGVGTPVRGGLNYREAHLLMEMLAASGKVRTVDLVEINPILDDRNQTGEVAVELLAGLFGQRIL